MLTKAEERKILEQIKGMIADTFYLKGVIGAVIPNAERSITDDAIYNAVEDLQLEYERNLKKDAEIGDKLRKLEFENHIIEQDTMRKTEIINQYKKIVHDQSGKIAELMEERDAMSDSVNGLQEILEKQDAEIVRLKAEIYDLRRELSK